MKISFDKDLFLHPTFVRRYFLDYYYPIYHDFALTNLFRIERCTCTRGVKTKYARRTRKIKIRSCRISSDFPGINTNASLKRHN